MLYIFQAYFKGGLCSEQTQKVKNKLILHVDQ